MLVTNNKRRGSGAGARLTAEQISKVYKLHAKGDNNTKIAKKIGSSRNTVSRLLNQSRRDKDEEYRKYLQNLPFHISSDGQLTPHPLFTKKVNHFKRRAHNQDKNMQEPTFTEQDVINKIWPNPRCYITGKYIDLADFQSYQFDHIIPRIQGGTNELDNLGLASADGNGSKGPRTIAEQIQLSIETLEYQGYKVTKKPSLIDLVSQWSASK